MIQEDKELLLKDLCCRLHYGVKCYEDGVDYPFEIIGYTKTNLEFIYSDGYERPIEFIKPYLRPMSSMTDSEKEYFFGLTEMKCTLGYAIDKVRFCLEHHLDMNNLIPKGLALEAPEDMYKIKEK